MTTVTTSTIRSLHLQPGTIAALGICNEVLYVTVSMGASFVFFVFSYLHCVEVGLSSFFCLLLLALRRTQRLYDYSAYSGMFLRFLQGKTIANIPVSVPVYTFMTAVGVRMDY